MTSTTARSDVPRLLFVVAMEAEARALRRALDIPGETVGLHERFPVRFAAARGIGVATNGLDPVVGLDAIATQPAVVTSLLAAEVFGPDVVISAGTAGGFASRGGAIGDVVLSTEPVAYHDRRIDIPGWDAYGRGHYEVAPLSFTAEAIGARPGCVTTGNSLDAPDVDRAAMASLGTDAKDMEAAAVAWVARQLGLPFLALKAITDLVDEPESTADQFQRNLQTASEALARVAVRLVERLRD